MCRLMLCSVASCYRLRYLFLGKLTLLALAPSSRSSGIPLSTYLTIGHSTFKITRDGHGAHDDFQLAVLLG